MNGTQHNYTNGTKLNSTALDQDRVVHLIAHLQKTVGESEACQSFIDVMHRSMMNGLNNKKSSSEGTAISWSELPMLCCQAVGGDPKTVVGITAAWSMLYTAAHTMDAVEDNDEPDTWWADLGSPVAINTATGLYAISTLTLMDLFNLDIPHSAAIDIIREFQLNILRMCSGQHIDITSNELNLDEYWQVAETKSGSFFDLACFAGARIASDDPYVLSGFSEFGRHLGILLQISDDTKDVWSLISQQNIRINHPFCLLPIVYTMSVSSPEKCSLLSEVLQAEELDQDSISVVRTLLEESGCGLYLITKAEQHILQAQQAIASMDLNNSMYNKLMKILDQVSILKKV